MKNIAFDKVDIKSGYLFDKQELNRKVTINAVYDRFTETGLIAAFNFDYNPNDPASIKPDVYWDSDVAKWMEGAAYIIKKHPTDEKLIERVESLIENIKKNQCDDGYFNIYFIEVAPEQRFKNRKLHELYCAGHLMEAAVAYAEATGRLTFLECMEKYADCIQRAFVDERTAEFYTPGHQEIELALVKMYRYTGKKKYLDLAAHFVNMRGKHDELDHAESDYSQNHLPVREQKVALGHSVRATYLYTAMAYLAKELDDKELLEACKALFEDVVERKMYITGGIGSTNIGEAFTVPHDLSNDAAYAETCASIGLVFFAAAMQELEPDSKYADVVECALYNGILSGLSLDGEKFFYENPLEVNLKDRFESRLGKRRLPLAQRPKIFGCSCCPPNINRLLPAIGSYLYSIDGDTLYVNQYVSSTLSDGDVFAEVETAYPNNGEIKIKAKGVGRVAVRIPGWCDSFKLNLPYVMQSGYAVVENSGEIILTLDMKVSAVFSDCRVRHNNSRLAVMRGPIVYCAEAVDNGEYLHALRVSPELDVCESFDDTLGLYTLEIKAKRVMPFVGKLYARMPAELADATVKMIPYNSFANRGASDRIVWLHYSAF